MRFSFSWLQLYLKKGIKLIYLFAIYTYKKEKAPYASIKSSNNSLQIYLLWP